MFAVKILEKKSIIRLFGIALTIAPFFNIASMVWIQHSAKHYRWNKETVIAIMSSGSPLQYGLGLLSIIIGIIMLRGSTAAWKYVLLLLGAHIITQIGSIGQNMKENWLWGPFFLVNVSLFIFIADQLVFKSKAPVKKNPDVKSPPHLHVVKNPEPVAKAPSFLHPSAPVVTPASADATPLEASRKQFPTLYTKKRTMIQFEKFGPWAQLISVSSHKIHVRCIKNPPAEFAVRKVEIDFRNGLVLTTWFDRKTENDFYFEYPPLTDSQIELLDMWVKKHAA